MTKVAGKLTEIKDAGGGDAIGVIVGTELSNEDYDTAAAFAAASRARATSPWHTTGTTTRS